MDFLFMVWAINVKWKMESDMESFHLTMSTYFWRRNVKTDHKQAWVAKENGKFSVETFKE